MSVEGCGDVVGGDGPEAVDVGAPAAQGREDVGQVSADRGRIQGRAGAPAMPAQDLDPDRHLAGQAVGEGGDSAVDPCPVGVEAAGRVGDKQALAGEELGDAGAGVVVAQRGDRVDVDFVEGCGDPEPRDGQPQRAQVDSEGSMVPAVALAVLLELVDEALAVFGQFWAAV